MTKLLFICFFPWYSFAGPSCDAVKDEWGAQTIENATAYQLLSECRQADTLTASGYRSLANLISSGYGEYPSVKERFKDGFNYHFLSAVNGGPDDVENFASFFHSGEAVIGIKKDLNAAKCIEGAVEITTKKRAAEILNCMPEEVRKLVR